jgi:hypothetical protein
MGANMAHPFEEKKLSDNFEEQRAPFEAPEASPKTRRTREDW